MRKIKPTKTILNANTCIVGEMLCTKVSRMMYNKEPITAEAPIIYTAKKDGILPQYDIRTDRWEIAQEAMGAISKSEIAKGKAWMKEAEEDSKEAQETIQNAE